jgi:hypothetical protein
MVRVLGDLTGLNKAFQDATTKGQKAAGTLHTALSGTLAALNQTGVLGPFADALAGVDQSLATIGDHAKKLGPTMLGVGGALAGVGAGLTAIGSKDEAAHKQLQAAVEATGKSYDDYAKQVEDAIKSQEKFGHTAGDTSDALRILTTATGDPAKALQYLGTASDLAAAKHESLSAAAGQLGKVYNGSTRLLKEFGVEAGTKTTTATKALEAATKAAATADQNAANAKQRLADLEAIDAGKKHLTTYEAIALRDAERKVTDTAQAAADAHQKLAAAQDTATKSAGQQGSVMTALATKLHGQASAAADTFGGKLAALKAKIEDAAAAFGQKYGPAITAAGSVTAGLGGAVTAANGISQIFAKTQKDVSAATKEAAAAAESGQLAFKGLGVAEDEAGASGLVMLGTIGLVVVAIAALGVAAYLIYRNWSTIWPAMKAAVVDVFDWIKNNWPIVLGILTGGLGLAVGEIIQHWNTILNFLEGVPGRIAHLATGMWNGIANAFVDVINFVIRIWNDLHFKIPSVGFGPFRTPSFTLGLPQIPDVPHLAQGGLITRDGLVYAHAGEAITPAGRAGPAIVINDAHFSSDIDIELFLRRAAWTIQTQKI